MKIYLSSNARGAKMKRNSKEKEKKMSTGEVKCVQIYLHDAKSESHAWMFLMCVLSHDGFLSPSEYDGEKGEMDSVRKDNGNIISKTLKYHQKKPPHIDLSHVYFSSYLAFICLHYSYFFLFFVRLLSLYALKSCFHFRPPPTKDRGTFISWAFSSM